MAYNLKNRSFVKEIDFTPLRSAPPPEGEDEARPRLFRPPGLRTG